MKKKLLLTVTALVCALTCAFGLAACNLFDNGDGKPSGNKGITATSAEIKEVAHDLTVSGWALTDTVESEKTERYCIDLYIYVATIKQYDYLTLDKSDFTANGTTPIAMGSIGNEFEIKNNNFREYMSEQKPYLSEIKTKENGNDSEGYTYIKGNEVGHLGVGSLSRNKNYIQRYVLEFEQPVVAATIKYKNTDTVKKYDEHDVFPSSEYTASMASAFQMFVTDKSSYKVTYSTTTKNYKTRVDKVCPDKEIMVDLKGVEYNGVFTKYEVKAEQFFIEVNGQKYKASSFYKGVDTFNTKPQMATDLLRNIDEYKDADLSYIKATRERWDISDRGYANQASGPADYVLIFDGLKTKPDTFKLFFNETEITIA